MIPQMADLFWFVLYFNFWFSFLSFLVWIYFLFNLTHFFFLNFYKLFTFPIIF